MLKTNFAAVAAAIEARLLAPLERAATGALNHAIAVGQAERGRELIVDMFDDRSDPSGAPWTAPARNYGHPLLEATGALRASGQCIISREWAKGHNITFAFTDEKAPWHHFGTKRGGPTTDSARAQNRKSFRAGQSETWHIPPRRLVFTDEAGAARWIADLDDAGQMAADRWLTENIAL